ncbi:uncharacterized protein LOC123668558 [Melitaea cinxia]|uniref:uncharacterized protein LOC123668558 n=1 Tax=Melitaea cinxia TaxID=113334 RepID=UPI001E27458D|nr:uncharacterized protein LOC123668558 [Melitaea cinxia]
MYESECWATKVTAERRVHAAEMRMLRWLCGVTRKDRIRNKNVTGSLKVASVTKKIRRSRLAWYGHVMKRDERYIGKRMRDECRMTKSDRWVKKAMDELCESGHEKQKNKR